jgi:flavin reductase (DIM6/NTAB) family NADH-FMN oxidoreductase RutF
VNVVSSVVGEGDTVQYNAMTVRFITQVSARPPRVALSISKTRLTHDFIIQSGCFAVSVLAEGQELLGGHFGLRSGRDADKLLEVATTPGTHTGAPILEKCSAWFECRVEAVHDMGACSLFIAEVLGGDSHHVPSLIYRDEDYFG